MINSILLYLLANTIWHFYRCCLMWSKSQMQMFVMFLFWRPCILFFCFAGVFCCNFCQIKAFLKVFSSDFLDKKRALVGNTYKISMYQCHTTSRMEKWFSLQTPMLLASKSLAGTVKVYRKNCWSPKSDVLWCWYKKLFKTLTTTLKVETVTVTVLGIICCLKNLFFPFPMLNKNFIYIIIIAFFSR